jgi:hypothetical protein
LDRQIRKVRRNSRDDQKDIRKRTTRYLRRFEEGGLKTQTGKTLEKEQDRKNLN